MSVTGWYCFRCFGKFPYFESATESCIGLVEHRTSKACKSFSFPLSNVLVVVYFNSESFGTLLLGLAAFLLIA